ncbi:hypothetical protein CC78DRAFT_104693 [Lojkania enalia]|uniref:Uncharacterized protein n=1 Tax=Lojkania enalia TaxID=147567 RepID=A0A9P4KIL1_9PLEO|nr:hypothetical protein CC78DRAFT_104693 [Didymosphaeria enalia]
MSTTAGRFHNSLRQYQFFSRLPCKYNPHACHFHYSTRALSSNPSDVECLTAPHAACNWAADTHSSLSAWSQWVVCMSGPCTPMATLDSAARGGWAWILTLIFLWFQYRGYVAGLPISF